MLPALAALALSCGPTEPADTPPPELAFGPIGSLAKGDAGKGGFRFGAASAATQIEDQNTATDWWLFTGPKDQGGLGKGEDFVGNASNGYTLALEDIGLLVDMGLDTYRFSIEWARIEPVRDQIDMDALAHYSEFIDALLAAGIRPMVTLHHFSNPVWVDDPRDVECASGPTDANLCGWNHPEGAALVQEEFAEHATLLAQTFGDRVDDWCTLNEPLNYILGAYGGGYFPPGEVGITDPLGKIAPVARNYIAAHALAYDAIKDADTIDAFDDDGEAALVGIPHATAEWVPSRNNQLSDDPADLAAVDRLKWVYEYLFIDAILEGGFDPDLDGTLDEPHPEWAGKLDWLGVQYYFRGGVTAGSALIPVLELTPCFGAFDLGACVPPIDESYYVAAMAYEHHPDGLGLSLLDWGARWPELPLVVSESGISAENGTRRAEATVRALENIAEAQEAGVDVRGYYHWSLFDNFEWALGFAPRFGLYRVDYDTFARTPTEGATVLGDIAKARKVTSQQRATLGGDGPLSPETAQ
jgi:beta-glucosidase/6-phospho-beta-glucosidase/beta-galactosidase